MTLRAAPALWQARSRFARQPRLPRCRFGLPSTASGADSPAGGPSASPAAFLGLPAAGGAEARGDGGWRKASQPTPNARHMRNHRLPRGASIPALQLGYLDTVDTSPVGELLLR